MLPPGSTAKCPPQMYALHLPHAAYICNKRSRYITPFYEKTRFFSGVDSPLMHNDLKIKEKNSRVGRKILSIKTANQ